MVGDELLSGFSILVMLSALVKDNVDDFVVLADILGRLGHDGVDDFAE